MNPTQFLEFGVAISVQATIVVGPAERPEREQWAVAHEIGESVAYRVFDALGSIRKLRRPRRAS